MQFLFYTTSFKSYSSVFGVLLLFFPVLREWFVTFELPHGNVKQTDRVSCLVFNMRKGERGRRLESSNVINLSVSLQSSSPLLLFPCFTLKKKKERKKNRHMFLL